ncbi:hypothetical protein ACX8Z9_04510 [Arthrobacter halodurans]|uniref:Uncharacterized protein n=1 Tax=Arthrobacter halodurans TaxID=516699 RepID=A0ABV4UPT3_9MICC
MLRTDGFAIHQLHTERNFDEEDSLELRIGMFVSEDGQPAILARLTVQHDGLLLAAMSNASVIAEDAERFVEMSDEELTDLVSNSVVPHIAYDAAAVSLRVAAGLFASAVEIPRATPEFEVDILRSDDKESESADAADPVDAAHGS